MMGFRWSNNALDNALFAEFAKEMPDEQWIHTLIQQGADINAIDLKGESVLIDAIGNINFGLDKKYIQLIVDLGANLEYSNDGLNCLYDAVLTMNYDIVELLLNAGANPNCFSIESSASLLDWAESKLYYEWLKNNGNAEMMVPIVQLLKRHHARSFSAISVTQSDVFYLNHFSIDNLLLS